MENPDPVALLAFVAVLGTFVTKVVDAIRRQWPRIDGLGANALAWALGAAVAAALDVRATEAILELAGGGAGRPPAPIVDWIITGAAIAAGAGLLHDLAKRPTVAPTVVVDTGATGGPDPYAYPDEAEYHPDV